MGPLAESLAAVLGLEAAHACGEPSRFVRHGSLSQSAWWLAGTAAWWDVELAIQSPRLEPLRGRARISREGAGLRVVARFSSEITGEHAAYHLAGAALDWGALWRGLGEVTEAEVDGGIRWRQRPWSATTPATAVLGGGGFYDPWPLHISSWVRGEWWILSLGQAPRAGLVSTYPLGEHRAPVESFDDICPLETWAVAAVVRPAQPSTTASPFAIPHCPEEAKGETVLSVARRVVGEAGRVERLSVLPEETWRTARAAPISPILARIMGLPEGMGCPVVALGDDPMLGRCTAGLLDIACPTPGLWSGRLGDTAPEGGFGGLMQWVLGDGYAAVTVLPRRGARDVYTTEWLFEYWTEMSAPGCAGPEMRAALAQDFGTVLSYLPYRVAPSGAEYTYRISFDPDAQIGWPDRVRVGDTAYGRVRLYVSPVLTHIVMDLK